ncbi:MAG: tetratricopeptide repeat protein [Rhodobacteraceae bacterium]|nr:tetratricopeptide repeat protein [Paracoccaceae bacterium]
MTRFLLPLAFALAGSAGLAADCPPPPDHDARLKALMAQARSLPSEMGAADLSRQMWELWADAPDEQAQAILDRGMRKRSSYDLLGAIADFDRLVEYCPDYAEGYNQRAFALFLGQDYPAALTDLNQALARSPDHVAALSGRALTLMALGRIDEARADMTRALALNPWIPERGLAAPGGPLAPLGEDI